MRNVSELLTTLIFDGWFPRKSVSTYPVTFQPEISVSMRRPSREFLALKRVSDNCAVGRIGVREGGKAGPNIAPVSRGPGYGGKIHKSKRGKKDGADLKGERRLSVRRGHQPIFEEIGRRALEIIVRKRTRVNHDWPPTDVNNYAARGGWRCCFGLCVRSGFCSDSAAGQCGDLLFQRLIFLFHFFVFLLKRCHRAFQLLKTRRFICICRDAYARCGEQ